MIQSVGGSVKPEGAPRLLARWQWMVAALVFAMVVVGGITRLTGSGLSITEWKPVTGALPPLSEAGWLEEFGKYQQSPQFKQVTGPAGMTLGDFKFIYFWEWVHRLLGRLIGVAYAVPFAWFWLRKKIPPGFKIPLLTWLALGALQGVAGWWMVASGLSERPHVSHYRLAVHLLLALVILSGLVWTAFNLRQYARCPGTSARLTRFGGFVLAILLIELLLGALTAGLRAGYVSNTWPWMYGKFLPPGFEWSMKTLRELPSNAVLIHFLHRWWAWVVVAVLVVVARKIRGQCRIASVALHSAFGAQILLGIATLLTRVNVSLAVLHQACAALVMICTVWCLHVAGRRSEEGED